MGVYEELVARGLIAQVTDEITVRLYFILALTLQQTACMLVTLWHFAL